MSEALVYDWEDPSDFDYSEKAPEPILVVVGSGSEGYELSEESRRGLAQLARRTISVTTVVEPEKRGVKQKVERLSRLTGSDVLPASKDAGFLDLIKRSIKSYMS